MKRTTIFAAGFAIVTAAASPGAAQAIDGVISKIRDTKSITIGYRETLVPTSYVDNSGKPTGYAIDLCLRLVDAVKQELAIPDLAVKYVPVTIQTRQALVANGTVDLECGGTVNTYARNKQVDFTPVSYVSANQFLVLRSSGIKSLEDLKGKIVVVATGGSSEPELKKLIAEQKLVDVKVLNVDDHPAALIAVESRRGDAYFSDNAAFFNLILSSKQASNLAVIGPEIGYAPQAFMMPKNNPTFQWIVNRAMGRMFVSGEAETIFKKWFSPYGIGVSPKLRAAWDTFSYPE